MAAAPEEMIIDPDETEEEMFLRIEREERARLDAEDDEARPMQRPMGSSSPGSMFASSGSMLSSSTGRMLARCTERCGGGDAGGSSGGQVDLRTVAYRFGLLGSMAFGGSPAQVALLRTQPWRSELADDAAFASLVALCECLPGFTAAQIATARTLLPNRTTDFVHLSPVSLCWFALSCVTVGVLQGGAHGGAVALAAYAAAGTLALTALGALQPTPPGAPAHGSAHAPSAATALLGAIEMGMAASAVALLAKSAMQLASVHATTPPTRSICLAAAALGLVLPSARWLPPAVLVAAALAAACERWWAERQLGSGGANTQRDEEEEEAALEDERHSQHASASTSSKAAAAAASSAMLESEGAGAGGAAARGKKSPSSASDVPTAFVPLSPRAGLACFVAWLGLWLLLTLLRLLHGNGAGGEGGDGGGGGGGEGDATLLGWLEATYRCGSLVFGGGTVVVPLLRREVAGASGGLGHVSAGGTQLPPSSFLEGVALSHALPGPGALSLAAYAGGYARGTLGALLGAVAVHAPGALVVYAALPYWATIRASRKLRTALVGVHAAAAGLVLASSLTLLKSANTPPQHAVGLLAFASLHSGWPAGAWRLPPRHQPALTVALGGVLGVPFCLPWLVAGGGGGASAPPGTTWSPAAGSPSSSATAAAHATGARGGAAPSSVPPPPPRPFPPDPSPPPPPMPRPPDDDA